MSKPISESASRGIDNGGRVEGKKESALEVFSRAGRFVSKLATGAWTRKIGTAALLVAGGCNLEDPNYKVQEPPKARPASVATQQGALNVESFANLGPEARMAWMEKMEDGSSIEPINLNECPHEGKNYKIFGADNKFGLFYTQEGGTAEELLSADPTLAASVKKVPIPDDVYSSGILFKDETGQSKLIVAEQSGSTLVTDVEVDQNGGILYTGELELYLQSNGAPVSGQGLRYAPDIDGNPRMFYNVLQKSYLLDLQTGIATETGLDAEHMPTCGNPFITPDGLAVASLGSVVAGKVQCKVAVGEGLEGLANDPIMISGIVGSVTDATIIKGEKGEDIVTFGREIGGVKSVHGREILPDEPTDGTDATDATDATEGTDTTDGTATDGTTGTDTTDGTDATDGTTTGIDVTDGTEGTDSTDAAAGTDTTDATDGTATDGTTGTDTTDTTDVTDSTDSTDGTAGTDTTDATDATEGIDTTDSTDGTAGTDTTDSTDSTDGTTGTDTTDSTDNTDSTDGTGGTDTTDATDGTDSTDGTVEPSCEVDENGDFTVKVGGKEVKVCKGVILPENDVGQKRFEVELEGTEEYEILIKALTDKDGQNSDIIVNAQLKPGKKVLLTCDQFPDVSMVCEYSDPMALESTTVDKNGHKLEWKWLGGAHTGSSASLTETTQVDADTLEIVGYLKKNETEYLLLNKLQGSERGDSFETITIKIDKNSAGKRIRFSTIDGEWTDLEEIPTDGTDATDSTDNTDTTDISDSTDATDQEIPTVNNGGGESCDIGNEGDPAILALILAAIAALNRRRRV
ncbi:MAG: hypothetical protein AAB373_00330 [Patescibacteria group bacterium]